jgi:hypothetical protein
MITLFILECLSNRELMAWLANYIYCKSISLSRASGAVSNYQIKVVVHRSTGSDSGADVYIGTKCETDYDDIRFTKSDGTTLLDYWIESSDANSATIWVEFDSIGTGATTFYLYYGYAAATAVSNGVATFLFFDDFLGTSLDTVTNWDVLAGDVTVSGSHLILTGTAGTRGKIITKTAFAKPARFRAMMQMSAINAPNAHVLENQDDSSTNYDAVWTSNIDNQFSEESSADGGAHYTDLQIQFDDLTVDNIFEKTWDTNIIKIYQNGTLKNSATLTIPTGDMKILFREGTTVGSTVNIDWVFAANFQTTEPAFGAWGSEQRTILSIDGLAIASVKAFNSLAIESIKTWDGL